MLNILIPTQPDDIHSIYVKLSLEKIGHSVDLWYTADMPTQQTHAFFIDNNLFNWHAKDIRQKYYDIVWYRRPRHPVIPEFLHAEDLKNAKKENIIFYESMWKVILPQANWINPIDASSRANSKLLQLKLAADIGLKIPKTLITNNPKTIKGFIRLHQENVIYKPLYPVRWLEVDAIRLTYTQPIYEYDLPSDKVLQTTPGIFQEKINKAYELRITFFNKDYIAVKIDSQKHEMAVNDWRSAPTNELSLEKVYLPDEIVGKCQLLMEQLGIVFGCFDFIVTNLNEYYFLEVNEQGQFLWIEQVNPQIKMLQKFVEFINTYDSKVHKQKCNLSDFDATAEAFKKEAMTNHVNPPQF